MPGLNGAVYQISSLVDLPPTLPQILKEFAKAAIRTQPSDLLVWSRDYFYALSQGETPAAKDRWKDSSSLNNRPGITNGLLRTLHKQLSGRNVVGFDDVIKHWTGLGLDRQRLDDLLELVAMTRSESEVETTECDWSKLLALAAGQLGDSLSETMIVLCHILTSDRDGGSSLSVDTFIENYTYLAHIDGDIPEEDIIKVVEYARKVGHYQNETINEFNLKSELCPNMH